MDLYSLKVWFAGTFLGILAYIDRGTITFILCTLSTLLAITYHIIKIKGEIKKKNEPQSDTK